MKKIMQLKNWKIYQNNKKEVGEYGFEFTIIHPQNAHYSDLSPQDSDFEMNSLEDCVSWIENYDNNDYDMETEKVHDDITEFIANEINSNELEGCFEISCGDGVTRFVDWKLTMEISDQEGVV